MLKSILMGNEQNFMIIRSEFLSILLMKFKTHHHACSRRLN